MWTEPSASVTTPMEVEVDEERGRVVVDGGSVVAGGEVSEEALVGVGVGEVSVTRVVSWLVGLWLVMDG